MPHTLRSLELTDEITAELTVLTGFDQDLAAEATRTSNRIRGLLTQFHPSLERVLGPRLDHRAVTWLLERYGSPAALRKAGRRRLVELIRPKAPRMAARLIDDVFPCEDGHAQERSLLGGVIARLRAKDLVIANRNFCFRQFLLAILDADAAFAIREHKKLTWESAGPLYGRGRIEGARVRE